MNTRSLPHPSLKTTRTRSSGALPKPSSTAPAWIAAIRGGLAYLREHPLGCEIAVRRMLREGRA
ncbi:MAG: hypothetical protein JNJ70_21565 [Verrucomicrobiales bacterium]|nr:hypothetical protein [Verrucomicrobiales bacterium]